MLEPADSQEAYDFTLLAIEISERWEIPVLLRMTTRVCHSKSIVRPRPPQTAAPPARFEHDRKARVMIPAYARPAHVRLRRGVVGAAQLPARIQLGLRGGDELAQVAFGRVIGGNEQADERATAGPQCLRLLPPCRREPDWEAKFFGENIYRADR